MAIHIGIGSWADSEYVGVLYPPKLRSTDRLSGYARWFDHVEVNASYYSTPTPETTAKWIAQTPDHFTFTIKLHRAFSQSPDKSARNGALIDTLKKGVEPLIKAKRLAAFFLVLPPSFGPDRHRLEELDALTEKLRPHLLAVELRHNGWVDQTRRTDTLNYFRERELVWIAVDMPRIAGSTIMPPVDEVTNPALAYLRMHGRNPNYLQAESAEEGHTYAYKPAELKELAERIKRLSKSAKSVQAIANNHAKDYAPQTAIALKKLLGMEVPTLDDNLELGI